MKDSKKINLKDMEQVTGGIRIDSELTDGWALSIADGLASSEKKQKLKTAPSKAHVAGAEDDLETDLRNYRRFLNSPLAPANQPFAPQNQRNYPLG